MRILVTGATGMIGSVIVPAWRAQGHEVLSLSRIERPDDRWALHWNPPQEMPDPSRLERLDAVVHLAGTNIAERRWSADRKAELRDSRVVVTEKLSLMLAGLTHPPATALFASAVGYYGNRGAEILTEASAPGSGFLASLCTAWEAAADPLRARGVRVVHLRFGIVLSRQRGALRAMIRPYQFGLGSQLGDGQQYISWITLEDAFGVIRLALRDQKLSGPINVVAPAPATQAYFSESLANALHRPAPWRIPATALRWALGDMADELLLSSTRVHPQVLKEASYRYLFPELRFAFTHLLR
jgi:uncharacterized protein